MKIWKFLPLLAILFFHSIAFTGNSTDDRLTKSSNQEKMKIYLELVDEELKKDPDKALKWSKACLAIAQKEKNYYYQVEANRSSGTIFKRKGLYDSALVYFQKVETLAKQKNDEKILADVYGNQAAIFIDQGELEKGIESTFKAIKLQEKFKNQRKIGRMYVNLGDVYAKLNNNKKAHYYLNLAIRIAQKENDLSLLAAAQNTYGISFTYTGELDSSLVYFQQSAQIREKLKEYAELYWNYNNIGGIHYYSQQFDLALEYFNKALQMGKKMGSPSIEATTLNNIGAIYKEMNQYDLSIKHHLMALNLARKIKLSNVELDALENLKITAEAKGDYKQAFQFQNEFITLKDSVLSQKTKENINKMQIQYNVEKKNTKIKTQNQLLQKANTIRLTLIIISILILVIAVISILSLRSKQKQKIQAVLFEEKQKGLKQIIETEEKERTRIAKELHDGVVQDLTVIFHQVNQLSTLSDDQRTVKIGDLLTHIKQTSTELRSISHQMMPLVLQEKGLVQALEELFERSFSTLQIEYTFDIFGVEERLPQKIEISLYRIAQELINNIIKHSGATEVSCILRKKDQFLLFVLDDNGKGMIESNLKKGIGLESLQSRIEFINGKMVMDSDGEMKGLHTFIQIPIA